MRQKIGNKFKALGKDLKKYRGLYVLIIPVVAWYIIFQYKPLYGMLIAFKDFTPMKGIWASPWTDHFGFGHFIDFFQSFYFKRLIKNTLTISLSSIIFGFPAPIILALLLNEIKSSKFKRITQTITYLPHFISIVVVCELVKLFVSETGFITQFLSAFGVPQQSLLTNGKYFVPIYVISGIWSGIGWGTIVYLAALSGVDQELYEAAQIDGAGRWKQTLHVTLPGIANTVIIMLLMRMGSVMSVGYEKIMLLYNSGIYDTADVISTYVYRKGLLDYQWSYSAAVGLFNNLINFMILFFFNRVSKKYSEVSLW